ncbi:hypothetical protein MLD38_002282 [Melastoma candidum]|uniref:Uncharacterized protein n=1 Tax=Melastoma candidum TaxID=119954 RepID=A0ACB9SJZ1_9MYRT|nr:hypothetical protein MLD38_002282 [Melastoma candidum]
MSLGQLFAMPTVRRREFPDNGFTFPSVEAEEDCLELEFEFGSITPDSPFDGSSGNSPADHLFLNGKLLPHVFPCQKTRTGISCNPSRTSSMSSKDFSVLSSRSNSTNSRSSTCSGRTSDSSERSVSSSLIYFHKKAGVNTRIDGHVTRERERSRGSSCSVMEASYLYGSQRWQFITPAPSLSREASLRRRKPGERVAQPEAKMTQGRRTGKGVFGRFLRSFLLGCMQCHAMEPSRKTDVRRQN